MRHGSPEELPARQDVLCFTMSPVDGRETRTCLTPASRVHNVTGNYI